jgi:hypothetical protein
MTPLFKGIHDGQELFVMNLIIDSNRGKFTKAKAHKMKKIVFFEL